MSKMSLAFIFLLLVPGIVVAKQDVRLALLVGNQEGWVRDPTLNYVVTGDLKPMAERLKKLGFSIHGVLANKGPEAIRKAWRSVLKRLRQKPRVTTFFFYYSGHADRKYFHTGPKGHNPLTYEEFARFLGKVEVRRRFVLIDACFSGELLRQFGSRERYNTLMQKGLLSGKGVRKKLSFTDLRKHFPSQGERVRGLQILSSSRFLSYESQFRRGSVFTYHFLRGLKGKADLDKDGKISFNELYLYVKPRVRSETGQSPQQWLFRVGSETYGFAPVYKSVLRIDGYLVGELQVRVEGFVWRWSKRDRKAMRLAVSSGYGDVYWRKKSRCFQQRVYFSEGKARSLPRSRWLPIDCKTKAFVQKGDAILPVEAGLSDRLDAWSFDFQAGIWGTTGLLGANGDLGGGGLFGFRNRYFGLYLALGGAQSYFPQSGPSSHLLMSLRLEGGYRQMWGAFDLFAGVYGQAGLLLQDVASETTDTLPSFSPQLGVTVFGAYWFTPQISGFIAVDGGVVPSFSLRDLRFFFAYGLRLGLRFRL